ncbi:MAG: CPBP family intramembrane glutamic endopeptidase, partial [Planctomycetota bacterium]
IYSIAASAPFFVAYEMGIAFLYEHQPPAKQVRNLAEFLVHLPAGRLGQATSYLIPVVAGMVLLYALHVRDVKERAAREGKAAGRKRRWGGFRVDFLVGMFAEGVILALPLALLASEMPTLLSVGGSPFGQKLFRLTTMCGAGAYEELLFRLFLFTGLFYAAEKVFGIEKLPAGILAAVLSGVIFALFHFLIPSGHDMTFFVFASIAGIYLAGICHFRSFGAAVATHAIYDIFTVLVRE